MTKEWYVLLDLLVVFITNLIANSISQGHPLGLPLVYCCRLDKRNMSTNATMHTGTVGTWLGTLRRGYSVLRILQMKTPILTDAHRGLGALQSAQTAFSGRERIRSS